MKKIIIKGKYLHKSCIPILYLLLLFLGGCIHQYPDETPTEKCLFGNGTLIGW